MQYPNLNKANVLLLAEYFEAMAAHKLPDIKVGYNQGSFEPNSSLEDRSTNKCKTNCCIAGHAVILFADAVDKASFIKTGELVNYDNGVSGLARDALGLGNYGFQLFTSDPYGCAEDENGNWRPIEPTAAEAAAMLRRLAETGDCVWPPRG